MFISGEQMKNINAVQTEILKAVVAVCEKLDIKFYMVHGSLLGTVRNNGFIFGDDDIDIAFFRKDYETFLREAPKYLDSRFFVQSNTSDKNYPLEFAKIRDSETTYVIEIAKHIPMNHGIYIDVFPIDYFPKYGKIKRKLADFKEKLLKIRVSSVWDIKNRSFIRRLADVLAKIYCPSVKKAIRKIDAILTSPQEGDLVRISGGKPRERGIPKKWFDNPQEGVFESVKVYIPGEYDNYLTAIYGDYMSRTLLENKEVNEQGIEINACVVDTQKPYASYTT